MPSEQIVKWGVVGAGGIAWRRTIPEGIVPARNARLAAVFDTDPAANANVARQFNVKAAGSVDELLAAGLDAVYVASPPDAHCGQVLACAAAGKHVLCEKPLALGIAEAERMDTACRQAGVWLGTGFMMRFHAQHQAALELVRRGRLGKPVFARAQLSCWYPPIPGAWRQDPLTGGGGALIDMGSHCIDLLEMFFGPVRAVTCFTNHTVHDYPSEDSAVVLLQFENGALGEVDTLFCVPDEASENRLELYGSLGSILAKGTIGQGERGEMVSFVKEDGGGYDAQQRRTGQGGLALEPQAVNMYRAEIEEFSAAILEQRKPVNDARLGLRNQRLVAACYESARTGQVVECRAEGR